MGLAKVNGTSDRPIRISVSVFTDIIGIFHASVSDRIGIFNRYFSDANETIFVPASVIHCAHKVLPPTTKTLKTVTLIQLIEMVYVRGRPIRIHVVNNNM